MLTSSWIMVLPEGFTPEKFDDWYLYTHTVVAKQCDDLVHYCVNRAFAQQPPQACGEAYRIAQLWWLTPEKLQDSFTSYSGSAVRGDAFLNITLDLAVHPSIAFTEDVQLDVKVPASYDMLRRQYRNTADGTIVKVLAYGMSDDDKIGEWYQKTFSGLGQDERVRQHNFGTSIKRTLKIGLLGSLPGQGQGFWDWMLELWFDSRHDAEAFLGEDAFTGMWGELSGRSTNTLLSVLRGQEMMVSAEPIPHVE